MLRGGAAVVLGRRGRGLRGGVDVENFAAVSRLAAGGCNGCEGTNVCLFGQKGLGALLGSSARMVRVGHYRCSCVLATGTDAYVVYRLPCSHPTTHA